MRQGQAYLEPIWQYLPSGIREQIKPVPAAVWQGLEEIRLRLNMPLTFRCKEEEYALKPGRLVQRLEEGYRVTKEDLQRTILAISEHSLYAFADEIKQGYITIPGGHRVGLAGQVVSEQNGVAAMKNFSGIAFRIARECIGCGQGLLTRIFDRRGKVGSTLLISPPRCGKTTILRDLTRMLSDGGAGRPGITVSLVDERSELAGSYQGEAQLDVGRRTDVLDGCPKAVGMMMAVRALSPEVVVTDEIGGEADIQAVRECVRAGVAILTTAHGGSIEEILQRPVLGDLLKEGAFSNLVVLSRKSGPGTVETAVKWSEFSDG